MVGDLVGTDTERTIGGRRIKIATFTSPLCCSKNSKKTQRNKVKREEKKNYIEREINFYFMFY